MTMFRTLMILCTALAVTSCTVKPQTIINLHIDGAKENAQAQIVTSDSVYSAVTDSTGSALVIINQKEPGRYASIKVRHTNVPVYIENGKTLDVTINADGRDAVTSFSGAGAQKCTFMNSKQYLKTLYVDYSAEEKDFLAEVNKKEKAMLNALEEQKFDEIFNNLEKKRIQYMTYGTLLPLYSAYRVYYNNTHDTEFSDEFDRLLEEKVIEDNSLLGSEEYEKAMNEKIRFDASKAFERYEALPFVKKQVELTVKNIKNTMLVEKFTDEFISSYIKREGIKHLDELQSLYKANVKSAAKLKAFNEICEKWRRIEVGQPSPDFKYLDINNKEISLKDLSGKYVFIDVWATWCGPCRGELPHLKKLENKFEGKNIAFVSISCDQDKTAWEKMVKNEKLGGIQLHKGNDDSFMSAYMINGIPRFILLDKEGKILDAKMTRPSNEKTLKTLQSLKGI